MQKNCHEFIAYENLLGSRGGGARTHERGRPTATSDISKALPLVRRALKVLSEREVTPQLGLLKSTLLQLDSTFSERDYGASSFRDFMEKVAAAGVVVLRQSGRSMLVEVVEADLGDAVESPVEASADVPPVTTEGAPATDVEADDETLASSPMSLQDGIRAVQEAFAGATRWPMYVRQAKQFLRNAIDGFDERKYGFASVVDLLRAAGKEGVLRIERDRQGAIRVFPGAQLTEKTATDVQPADIASIDIPSTDIVMDGEVDADVPAAVGIVDVEADDQGDDVVEVPSFADAPSELVASALVLGIDPDEEEPEEGDVNGNIAGIATHEMMTTAVVARKRKGSPRAKSSRREASPAPAPARRGVKKTSRRQKADAK
jgi:hypothetical protein